MTFESSTIWAEVQDIIGSETTRTLYDYKGTVHTEKEDYATWDLSSTETVRDYLKSVAETGKVIFRIGLGDYVRRFFPYRNNLEFTLKRFPLAENGAESDKKSAVVCRYKAIFNPANNPQVGGSELETLSTEDLNNAEIVEVHLELVNRSMEPLRIKTTGGSFNNVKVGDLVKGLLGGESMKVLIDGKPSIDAIDLVEPDNQEKVSCALIPHGTRLTAIPTYIQESIGGIYNGGIGTFFQTYRGKKTWFVYPTFDTRRFDSKDRRAIFYAVPQEKLPQLDKSYKEVGNILKVAVTAQRKYSDSAELGLMNEGSGYRMPDARAFMKKPVEIKNGVPVASRARLNHEVAFKDRSDGLNFAPVQKTSSNPFLQRSMVALRSLGQIDLVWENADPELIYPGMPCKYVYMSHGKAISLKGVVLFVHAFSARVEKQNASAFRMTCRVTIACEAQSKLPDLPTQGTTGN